MDGKYILVGGAHKSTMRCVHRCVHQRESQRSYILMVGQPRIKSTCHNFRWTHDGYILATPASQCECIFFSILWDYLSYSRQISPAPSQDRCHQHNKKVDE